MIWCKKTKNQYIIELKIGSVTRYTRKRLKEVENCGLTFWTEKASDILTNSLQASVIKCD